MKTAGYLYSRLGGEIDSALVFRKLIVINTHIHIQAATHPQVHQRSYCIMCSLLGAALCDILHKVKHIFKRTNCAARREVCFSRRQV